MDVCGYCFFGTFFDVRLLGLSTACFLSARKRSHAISSDPSLTKGQKHGQAHNAAVFHST